MLLLTLEAGAAVHLSQLPASRFHDLRFHDLRFHDFTIYDFTTPEAAMSGIVVEKKDGKTIITVVQKDDEKPEDVPARDRAADAPVSSGRRTFLHDVIGRRLLFHLATGEEVEGILDGFDHESLRIEDAFLTGDNKQWRADWMILERRQLVAVSPAGRIRPRSPTPPND